MRHWIGTVLITVATLVVSVALVWHGEDVETVGLLLAAVGLFLDNRFKMNAQTDTLAAINENTNGKLDERIRRVVSEVIEDMLILPRKDTDVA